MIKIKNVFFNKNFIFVNIFDIVINVREQFYFWFFFSIFIILTIQVMEKKIFNWHNIFYGFICLLIPFLDTYLEFFLVLNVLSLILIYIFCQNSFIKKFFFDEALYIYFFITTLTFIFFLFGMFVIYFSIGVLDVQGLYVDYVYYRTLLEKGYFWILLSLLLNLGLGYFLWIIEFYRKLSFRNLFYFAILPKAAVLYFFFQIFYKISFVSYNHIILFLFFFANFSMVFGSIGGLLFSRINVWLAFSAIANTGHILLLIIFSGFSFSTRVYGFYIYFYIYFFCLVIMLFMLIKYPIQNLSDLVKYKTNVISVFFGFCILILTGLPPFFFFFAKTVILSFITILYYLLFVNSYVFLFYFIIMLYFIYFFISIVSVYYYFRILKLFLFDTYIIPKKFFSSAGTYLFFIVESPLEQFVFFKVNGISILTIQSFVALFTFFFIFGNWNSSNSVFNYILFFRNFFIGQINQIIENSIKLINTYFYLYFFWVNFSLILYCNLMGMYPFQYVGTAQAIIAIGLGFVIFSTINFFGFKLFGLKFFNLLWPQGSPYVLGPLLVFVEVVSYFSRAFSLGIRLFANIMAGHTLLKIFATIFYLSFLNIILVFFIFFIFLLILLLETAVAFLQAYVFILLSAIYVHDVYSGGH